MSKEPLLWYVASPYSHPRKRVMQHRAAMVDYIMAKLYEKYKVALIPPILISRVIKECLGDSIGTDFKEWKKVDLKYISRCDAVIVVMLPGWKESIGVKAEILFALRNQIPVKYFDTDLLEFVELKNE